MKKLLFIFLLPLSLQSFAQDSLKAEAAISAKDSAAAFSGNRATGNTENFTVKREKILHRRVYKVNSAKTDAEVFERAMGFARMVDVDYKADKGKKTITIPVSWVYQGRSNECIEDLNLAGTLTLEVKDLKTRITLTNISYKHFDKGTRNATGVAKSDLISRKADCAPQQGAVELLYNCNRCQQSLNHLSGALENKFEDLAAQYQEMLKKY